MSNKPSYPQDAVGFKAWADAACTGWPMELTALAYENWRDKNGDRPRPNNHDSDFAAAYAAHVLSGSSA